MKNKIDLFVKLRTGLARLASLAKSGIAMCVATFGVASAILLGTLTGCAIVGPADRSDVGSGGGLVM